jgi:hypothetical protein
MSQSVPIREQIQADSIAAAGRTVLSSWTGTIAIWLNRRQGRQDLSAGRQVAGRCWNPAR